MKLGGKKLALIGFVIVLLIGIPTTIFFLQQQQQTTSQAQQSTDLGFLPESSNSEPIQKNIGDEISLDVMVDPGTNLVSFVKLQILYDTDKITPIAEDAFVPDTVTFPTVLEGPVFSDGKIEITLSVGPDPTKAVQSLAKAGTVKFTAIANTAPDQPTLVTYGQATQVLSIGSGDQASENVLSSTTPAVIVIGGEGQPSGTLIPVPTGSITPTAPTSPTTAIPTTVTATNTPTPTTQASPSATPSPSPTGGGSSSNNQAPVCNDLAVDRATTGIAPYAITFTASGTDADGTISKVNFNFGDGDVSGDVTTSGGIGTNSINVSVSHEYQNSGTFTASAVLTDDSGDASSATSCEQTIIVQAGATATPGSGGQTTNPTATFTPTPSIAATGIFDTAIGIGVVSMFLIIGGSLLFFML